MKPAPKLEVRLERCRVLYPTDAGRRRAVRVYWREEGAGRRWSSFTLHGEPGESFEVLEHRAPLAAARVAEDERAGR